METLVEEAPKSYSSLSLPVPPMVWDSDVSATIAVTGTAFLAFLPMQI